MHFDLLQSISLAGDPATPNDDRAGMALRHAWVIDGATDLGPPGLVGSQGGAAWLASEAQAAFTVAADGAIETIFAGVADRLVAAYARDRTREPEGRWELPLASGLAVRIGGDALECGWLGDCSGLLRRGGQVVRLGPVADDRGKEIAHAASLAQHGLGNIKKNAPILADLRAGRGRPGIRVLGVLPEWMAEVETLRTPCAPGDELLLMTDGFAALVDSYAAYDTAGLMAAVAEHGLAAVAAELREIEQADIACARFPRFKVSDDATALWLRIGG
ncbi:serine/threonine-protein phosphatase [Sphingomonas cannabina]|uniref:protein phosphatase 2C domain-containing protein n=1 Tax=Sphingomonas cannabina TaxID=2899123 RepID=UPI001F47EC49|nr:protein phosphatase 2C domain-containing protein [Sphingomonas cannabina]UIJ45804.1 serine/threonine-protein phosphatase [Sphingomonas cannabina]